MSPNQNQRLEEDARSLGKPVHQVAVGLDRALWEAGPNPVTDFADALEFEGKPVMPPETRQGWEALGRFRDALTQFLVGKSAAFIGGVAVRSYGGRTGATLDFDILIDPALLQEVTSFLKREGAQLFGTVEATYTFHLKPSNTDVDMRVAVSPLDREALATAKEASFRDRKLQIVRPAPLAAMKLKAYSERKDDPIKGGIDRSDVLGLIRSGATSEQEVREILVRFRPDLLRELDEILA